MYKQLCQMCKHEKATLFIQYMLPPLECKFLCEGCEKEVPYRTRSSYKCSAYEPSGCGYFYCPYIPLD